jgi:hypothetical protein
MFKLIMIIVGLVFAFRGYRKTWYPAWAFLFNILISIYISIMTAPQIVDKVSYTREYLGDFAYSAGILAAAFIIFAVIQFLSYKFLTSVYRVSFPRILNSAGAAVLGLAAGLVLTGFLLFLLTIVPLDDYPAVRVLTQINQSPDKAEAVVRSSCNFIHSISFHACTVGVDKQMEKILTGWKIPKPKQDAKPADPNLSKVEVDE